MAEELVMFTPRQATRSYSVGLGGGSGFGCLFPLPKSFCRKFFVGAGCPLVSGGCVGCGAPVRFVLGFAPPPKIPSISDCGDAPMWLQVLPGTVPSRNAKL